jgi:hypothetical protein
MPIIELLLNPFALANTLNIIAIINYSIIGGIFYAAILERR